MDKMLARPDAPVAPVATPAAITGWYARLVKRGIDIVLGLVLLVLVLPLVLVGALVVRRSIGKPVFTQQYRVGRGGRPYGMRRLRTKAAHRHFDLTAAPANTSPSDGLGRWAVTFERTAATSFVRRCRLDVLPQLINVVRGEMSLVGPRPMLWHDAVTRRLLDHPRHRVRPGLTGPAQVYGGGQETPDEELAFDLAYGATLSWRRDMGLLIKSLVVVLRGRPLRASP